MVDTDGGAAAGGAGGGDALDGDVGGVLGNRAIFPFFHPEIVDGQEAFGVADALDLAGYAVARVLLLGHLPQSKAQYEQQYAQVAYPRAPQTHGMAGGEQRVPAIPGLAGGGLGHVQPSEDGFGVGDALGGHIAALFQGVLRADLSPRAADQLGQAQQVAQQQVQA